MSALPPRTERMLCKRTDLPPKVGPFVLKRLGSLLPMTQRTSSRTVCARLAVRGVNALSRLLRRGSGTVAGGRVGLALDHSLLTHLADGRTIIAISGTNGKTTTSALMRAAWGTDVGGNLTGANMPAGHVAALVASRSRRFILEVDEAWLPTILTQCSPRIVCLLNLSRDQLDRASEVRQLAERWKAMAVANPASTFVANASDPLIVDALTNATSVTWVAVPHSWHADALSCPRCTAPLSFADRWSCACGFAEPESQWRIDDEGVVTKGAVTIPLTLSLPGLFNRINAAFVLAALDTLGESVATASSRLSTLDSVQGRYGLRRFGTRQVRLLLAKNPAGVAALLDEPDMLSREIWVAINAQIADGKDPSWLYDAPFERLAGKEVTCLGERRLDVAYRLEVDGVFATVVDESRHLKPEGPLVTIIANYTAFQEWMRLTTPW